MGMWDALCGDINATSGARGAWGSPIRLSPLWMNETSTLAEKESLELALLSFFLTPVFLFGLAACVLGAVSYYLKGRGKRLRAAVAREGAAPAARRGSPRALPV